MENYCINIEENLLIIEEPQFELEGNGFESILINEKQSYQRITNAVNSTKIKLESRRYIGNKNKLIRKK